MFPTRDLQESTTLQSGRGMVIHIYRAGELSGNGDNAALRCSPPLLKGCGHRLKHTQRNVGAACSCTITEQAQWEGLLGVSGEPFAHSRATFNLGSNCSAPFPLEFSKPAAVETALETRRTQTQDYLLTCSYSRYFSPLLTRVSLAAASACCLLSCVAGCRDQ